MWCRSRIRLMTIAAMLCKRCSSYAAPRREYAQLAKRHRGASVEMGGTPVRVQESKADTDACDCGARLALAVC